MEAEGLGSVCKQLRGRRQPGRCPENPEVGGEAKDLGTGSLALEALQRRQNSSLLHHAAPHLGILCVFFFFLFSLGALESLN